MKITVAMNQHGSRTVTIDGLKLVTQRQDSRPATGRGGENFAVLGFVQKHQSGWATVDPMLVRNSIGEALALAIANTVDEYFWYLSDFGMDELQLEPWQPLHGEDADSLRCSLSAFPNAEFRAFCNRLKWRRTADSR